MIKLSIPLKELKAAMLFASQDGFRYPLNGVCLRVRTSGHIANLYASDGRRLACIRSSAELLEGDIPAEGYNVIIPNQLIKLATPYHKKTSKVELTIEKVEAISIPGFNDTPRYMLTFSDGKMTVGGRSVDGRFPVLDSVFPKKPMVFAQASLCLNARFVGDLHQAASLLKCTNDVPGVSLATSGVGDVIVARINGCEAFYCLIMPIRKDYPEKDNPPLMFNTPMWIDAMAPAPVTQPVPTPCTTP